MCWGRLPLAGKAGKAGKAGASMSARPRPGKRLGRAARRATTVSVAGR